jgi:multidrug transporter EmrE-like cation transporter
MDPTVFALVLGAALLHASWNALVKTGGDPFVRLALVNVVSGLCALPFVAVVAFPASDSWPYLFGSVVVHHAYYLALAYGYRFGDLSHVYPIARGVAPPLVAFVAWAFADEVPGALGLVAILVISSGIVSLAFTEDGRLAALKPMGFALATGVAIAGSTLFDGLGGRSAGDVFGSIVASTPARPAFPAASDWIRFRSSRRIIA